MNHQGFSKKTSLLFSSRKTLTYILDGLRVGLCDMDKKKPIAISLINFAISILIIILTHTDMLYSHKCIQCEFEMYFPEENQLELYQKAVTCL